MTSSRSLRWAVPAVAATLVAGAVVLPAVADDGAPDLSPRTAAQLLVDLGAQRQDALSGTVVATSRLGLPELPGDDRGTGPSSLASGSNTLRVWSDGPERQRVALLGTLAEYDVVRDGRDLWTYSSGKDEAVHRVLPERPDGDPAAPLGSELPSTPAEAADAALAALDPTTAVTVEQAVEVAGRDARQLVLTPEDGTTLVGSVRIAVDAATSAPLRVQVFAADTALPALEVGFTDVEFATPDRSVFAFSPPSGAEVVEKGELVLPQKAGSTAPRPAAGAAPTVVGEGWSSVLVLSGVPVPAAQQALLDQVTTRVTEGRLLTTALVSVLLTDDGRVLVGAVPPAALRDAA